MFTVLTKKYRYLIFATATVAIFVWLIFSANISAGKKIVLAAGPACAFESADHDGFVEEEEEFYVAGCSGFLE